MTRWMIFMDFDGDLPSGYVKIAMFMLDVDGGFLMVDFDVDGF